MKLQIASNRLPVKIKQEKGKIEVKKASGGLATGMSALQQEHDMLWTGSPGIHPSSSDEKEEIERYMAEEGLSPVWAGEEDYHGYYRGFSNKSIWPLFHYFSQYARYEESYWQAYKRVNRAFCNRLLENASEDDIFWINDYHLMLLPQMLREKLPHAKIGFFLHIPFPHYEVFRQLPWRQEILDGLSGASLVGFHTAQYADYFLHSAGQLLNTRVDDKSLRIDGRPVTVGHFPMGIDYDKFADCSQDPKVIERAKDYQEEYAGKKVILSVDRLDYSKGIIQRLRGFDLFLQNNPSQRGEVSLLELIVPSRIGVEQYQHLKKEIDEYSGKINGKYGTPFWTPVRYFYRSVDFPVLCGLYHMADIALVTPIRDGMNLVAKEYAAVHQERPGVLILSEFAGAVQQLKDSIIVNPNSIHDIAAAIRQALEMPKQEQMARLKRMQEEIRRTDVRSWAEQFIGQVNSPALPLSS